MMSKDNTAKAMTKDIAPVLKKMLLELPKDLIRGKIILRAVHLNSLVDNLNIFQDSLITIHNDYVNFKGLFTFTYGIIEFTQRIFLDDKFGDSDYSLYLINDKDKKSTITLKLENIEYFNQYLNLYQDNKILNNLTIDDIKVSSGKLSLISTEKIEISIDEKLINSSIKNIPLEKFGINNVYLSLNEDCITINANYSCNGIDAVIKKNLKITKVDIYKSKLMVLEFDDYNQGNDRISVGINYNIIEKIHNKFLELVIKLILNKNKKVRLDEEKERIIIY